MESKLAVDRPKRQKFGGRAKGTQNLLTQSAKEAITLAADGLGGYPRIIAWAKEDPLNERAFWASIYPKLLPLTVSGDANNPLSLKLDVAFKASAD